MKLINLGKFISVYMFVFIASSISAMDALGGEDAVIQHFAPRSTNDQGQTVSQENSPEAGRWFNWWGRSANSQATPRRAENAGFVERKFAQFGDQFKRHVVDPTRNDIKNDLKQAKDQLLAEVKAETKTLGDKIKSDYQEMAGNTKKDVLDPSLNRFQDLSKKAAIYSVFSCVAIFSIWYGYKYLFGFHEQNLRKPKIDFQSEHPGFWQRCKNYFCNNGPKALRQMIFDEQLAKELKNVIARTGEIAKRIKEGDNQLVFRNLLLWGPPGTGKTLFAKQFAQEVSQKTEMEYVFIDGSFFTDNTMAKIDALFERTNSSDKGVLIFIDHAEYLLAKRDSKEDGPTSKWNADKTRFLKYAKDRSNKFMLIFATSRDIMLDPEMESLIVDTVLLGLPCSAELIRVLQLYRDTILKNPENNSEKFIESVDIWLNNYKIEQIAEQLKGVSCADIEDFIHLIKTEASIKGDLVSEPIIVDAIERTKNKYNTLRVKLPNSNISVPAAV